VILVRRAVTPLRLCIPEAALRGHCRTSSSTMTENDGKRRWEEAVQSAESEGEPEAHRDSKRPRSNREMTSPDPSVENDGDGRGDTRRPSDSTSTIGYIAASLGKFFAGFRRTPPACAQGAACAAPDRAEPKEVSLNLL
jgi:hypothetical protein